MKTLSVMGVFFIYNMEILPKKINFHPVLKDVENIFWFFLNSIRMLSSLEIQNILKSFNISQEGYLFFNDVLDKVNEATHLDIKVNGNITTTQMNLNKQMVFIAKGMAILTYDYILFSKYYVNFKDEEKFRFLRHIRNGSAHNNRFQLKYNNGKGKWSVEEGEQIKWEDKIITRDLQEEEVFNNFISVFDIFRLALQFSNELYQIDAKT